MKIIILTILSLMSAPLSYMNRYIDTQSITIFSMSSKSTNTQDPKYLLTNMKFSI